MKIDLNLKRCDFGRKRIQKEIQYLLEDVKKIKKVQQKRQKNE